MDASDHQAITLRDPQPLLERTLQEWGGDRPLWIFGYGSLLWRREFEVDDEASALVHGWHRALRMRSRVNRGTPEQPGLVFALMAGGSCHGAVFRVPAARAESELRQLWQREMPTGVYDPRWLPCRTPRGNVTALAFTLHRGSPSHTGRLADEQVRHILAHARGRYGTTLAYLRETALELQRRGIRDREVERLVRLAAG
jgi:glutathione-specific gamma-glutamylcyclotransferase